MKFKTIDVKYNNTYSLDKKDLEKYGIEEFNFQIPFALLDLKEKIDKEIQMKLLSVFNENELKKMSNEKEAEKLLKKHVDLVPFFESVNDGSIYFPILEKIPGLDLKELENHLLSFNSPIKARELLNDFKKELVAFIINEINQELNVNESKENVGKQ